jgi:ATP-binding cassette subfamily B protein
VVLLLGLLAAPIALLLPLPLKIVADSVTGSHPLPSFLAVLTPDAVTSSKTRLLAFAVGLLILTALVNQLQILGTQILREYVGERMVLNFRSRLFEHVQRLSLSFHDAQGVAHSIYRIQYDAPALQWLTLDGVIPLTVAFATFISMLVVTALISFKLAAIALTVAPVLVILSHLYTQRLRTSWRRVHDLQNAAFGIVQEALGALRVVNAFGQEHRERERFLKRSLEGFGARIRVTWAEGSFTLIMGLTMAAGTAAVLFVGTRGIQAGELTLGDLLLVMAYLAQLYGPLQILGRQVAGQQRLLASVERTFELLDQAPAIVERSDARPISRTRGDVAFRGVGFAYDQATVLRCVSLEVPAGARVGIAGQTGAGKTTLLSLLIRFYDPTQGQVLLDGVDLRNYKLRDLRKQFAIVLQEPVLFSTTIADNIAYSRPGADFGEIVNAAKAANAHDFILRLPEGYETMVGERGMRLSGGERQRVALARAFLTDAPVLIFDEPTSSVDVETEAAIIEAMDRLMVGRTTFMIAHRLSTLAKADQIVFLHEGRVVETGAPDELLAGDGYYQRYFKRQFSHNTPGAIGSS